MNDILVVDSWPVLEWLRRREPARSRFRTILDQAVRGEVSLRMSRINLGEVWYQIARRWGLQVYPLYRTRISRLPIEIISVDDLLVDDAAELKARFSIAYADCFAAALAIRHSSPILTGDSDFLKLEAAGLLKVQWIGA